MSSEAANEPVNVADNAIVYVVDDDESMRDAVSTLLRSIGLKVKTFSCAQDFLAADRPDVPACLILDVRLKGQSGLAVQEQIAAHQIRMPIVFMTAHGDIAMSVKAMKAGARDFLAKPFRDQDMLDAVMAAIERDRQRRAADGEVSRISKRFETLSAREQQVMLLVTAGKMNKQVAGDLGISEITVKIHRGAAMRKMSARSLADLVRMADIIKPATLP
jgi:FixJ family two-component response regulator